MRVALLADIHGNADALGAVLSAARVAGVERLLIAGDLVGYYPDAVRVLDLLDEWNWVSVGGNHEAMLDQWRQGEDHEVIGNKYGTALARAVEELDAARIDMLVSLPATIDLEVGARRVRLCHGTPWNRDAYVYPDADKNVRVRFVEGSLDMVVFGHTHYPTEWRVGETLVVNPGSVGQPRDHMPGACWALWDTTNNNVEQHRESYDMKPLIARCQVNDPKMPFLWTVLTRTPNIQ